MCFQQQTIDLKLVNNRSFTEILKKGGPSVEPCGTPMIVCNRELETE